MCIYIYIYIYIYINQQKNRNFNFSLENMEITNNMFENNKVST